MSKAVLKFSYEKEPEEGKAPIMGTLYVQKWFAGDSKNLGITIDKKD
jgi:hypothetical protein